MLRKLTLKQEIIAPMPRLYAGTSSTCSTESGCDDVRTDGCVTYGGTCHTCEQSRVVCQTDYTCNEPYVDRGGTMKREIKTLDDLARYFDCCAKNADDACDELEYYLGRKGAFEEGAMKVRELEKYLNTLYTKGATPIDK